MSLNQCAVDNEKAEQMLCDLFLALFEVHLTIEAHTFFKLTQIEMTPLDCVRR